MNPGQLTKMLGLLKYQAEHGKDRKDPAQKALDVYKSLADPEDRASFLADFESNGGGKTAAALKFALRFTKAVDNKKSKGASSTEDYFCRSQAILIAIFCCQPSC